MLENLFMVVSICSKNIKNFPKFSIVPEPKCDLPGTGLLSALLWSLWPEG